MSVHLFRPNFGTWYELPNFGKFQCSLSGCEEKDAAVLLLGSLVERDRVRALEVRTVPEEGELALRWASGQRSELGLFTRRFCRTAILAGHVSVEWKKTAGEAAYEQRGYVPVEVIS